LAVQPVQRGGRGALCNCLHLCLLVHARLVASEPVTRCQVTSLDGSNAWFADVGPLRTKCSSEIGSTMDRGVACLLPEVPARSARLLRERQQANCTDPRLPPVNNSLRAYECVQSLAGTRPTKPKTHMGTSKQETRSALGCWARPWSSATTTLVATGTIPARLLSHCLHLSAL